MVVRLSPTTFATGANDELAVVDAYKVKDSNTVNSIKDINDLFKSVSLLSLKGSNLLSSTGTGNLLSSFDPNKGVLKVNQDSLLKGVITSNNGLMSSLKSLDGPLQDKLTTSDLSSDISVTIDGITSTVRNADLSTLKGVGSMINTLAVTPLPMSFTDRGGLVSLSVNLIAEARKLGMPGVFKVLTSGMTDVGLVGNIVHKLLPTVISKSDVGLLIDISRSVAGTRSIKQVPNLINAVTRAYKKYSNQSILAKRQNYNSMDESFENIKPGYKTCRRNDTETDVPINGTLVTQSTKDYKEALLAKADSHSVVIDHTDPLLDTSVNTPVEWYQVIANKVAANTASVTKKEEVEQVNYDITNHDFDKQIPPANVDVNEAITREMPYTQFW